jgi:zinc transporter ZupT
MDVAAVAGEGGVLSAVATPVLLSAIAGSATGIGGLIVYAMDDLPSDRAISFVLSFAAGVMMIVSVVDMWLPSALASGTLAGFLLSTAWVGAGVACCRLLTYMPIPEPDAVMGMILGRTEGEATKGTSGALLPSSSGASATRAAAAAPGLAGQRARNWRLGVLLMVVLTLHNLPEGLAVGVSTMKDRELGVLLCAAM